MDAFLLGINYWPRRSAMYMWERFDLGEIREDFARIRSLGLSVVRFFITWDDFQPQADRMDPQMLSRFDAVMDVLAQAGLRAQPTFFTGHMSGVNYLPEWTLDRSAPNTRFRTYARDLRELPYGIGDFYKGPLLDASRLHVRAIGERCRDHPALYMWDLGNEFSNLRGADNAADAANWSKTLTNDLLETSGVSSSAGTHSEDLTHDRGLRPASFCEPFPCAVMHGYSVYMDFARDRLDAQVVPFLCRLMQSMSKKPVLFNEAGNPTCADPASSPFLCLTEEEMATYCSRVLDALQRCGALGAFWWNWADYVPELANTPPFDRAPHELTFGVIRADGSFKPVAQTLQRFAQERRSIVPPPQPIVREDEWYAHLDKAYQKAKYEDYLVRYASEEH